MIQAVADELNLNRPPVIITAADQQTKSMLALAKREGDELSRRHQWSALIKEATHTTLAAEFQGLLATIAPGYRYMVPESVWIRDNIQGVSGGLSPSVWQYRKASNVSGPHPEFRIKERGLYLIPAPAAGLTAAFEFVSSHYCESAAGVSQAAWSADTDVGILDENLMTLGLKWRYLRSKGHDYSEEWNTYERAVTDAMARDTPSAPVDIGGHSAEFGIPFVPQGNWNL